MLLTCDPAHARTDSVATVYAGEAGGERLRLQVMESACTDSMSGESLALTAMLTLDWPELQGCERRLTGVADAPWRFGPRVGFDPAARDVEILTPMASRPSSSVEPPTQ